VAVEVPGWYTSGRGASLHPPSARGACAPSRTGSRYRRKRSPMGRAVAAAPTTTHTVAAASLPHGALDLLLHLPEFHARIAEMREGGDEEEGFVPLGGGGGGKTSVSTCICPDPYI
jgi:hypothetical protein